MNKLARAFEYQHTNPPAPFNPDFDPGAKARYAKVSESMEADKYYDNHSRQQCATEWARRYDVLKGESK